MESSSDKKRDVLSLQFIKIAGVVALYWTVSISMVFLNKYLLSGANLAAPLFITWFQCVVGFVICVVLGYLSELFPSLLSFPKFALDVKISREVLPLSFLFVGMITGNNLCLKYVGVAFYNIGRSLTTVFNVICTYLILRQKTSLPAIGCCLAIIFGFLLGVNQEGSLGTLSIIGVFFGVVSSLFVSLNAIFTKKTMAAVNDDLWKLVAYNNLNASFVFIPFIIITNEIPTIYRFDQITSPTFWLPMIVSGVFGIAMSFVTGLQIQVTSPLTHNVSGTAKAAFQTVLAVSFYSEVKSGLWWLSNVVVLGGSGAYTYVKQREMRQAKLPTASRTPNVESGPKELLMKTSDNEDI